MSPDSFVQAIRRDVRDSAVQETMDALACPPGRKPNAELAEVSKWFNSLSEDTKRYVQRAVELAVDNAVFGFFCVLDGVRVIEDPPSRGLLVLEHRSSDGVTILNDENSNLGLHDIYNAKD